MVQENHPVIEDAQTLLTDASDQDLDNLEFFIKKSGAGTYYDYNFMLPQLMIAPRLPVGVLQSMSASPWETFCQIFRAL